MSGKVGFIGLGTMGKPMAWNIHQAGYDLCIYNRTREKTKPFAEAGIKVCQSPKELAEIADTIIIMVTDSDALIDAVLGYHGITAGLQKDDVVINMSTVSQPTTLEVSDAIELEGGQFLEAPVSGTKKPAEDATLTILTAGPEKLAKQVEPLLKTMGNTVIHCGKTGQGTAMKLTINLLLGNMMQALSEAL
ncbi:MAG TPA: NAD(P)-dependent oxidoreductase, partial [Balneolaceae bacterium]|nr:NAD(P)-dependent oxidoreductase [Balneolaceae bacterium]